MLRTLGRKAKLLPLFSYVHGNDVVLRYVLLFPIACYATARQQYSDQDCKKVEYLQEGEDRGPYGQTHPASELR